MKKLLLILLLIPHLIFGQGFIANSGGAKGAVANGYVAGTLGWVANNTPFVVDADAQAFYTAAGYTTPALLVAINTLVVGLKTNSLWTNMLFAYPFTTDVAVNATSLDQMKWNLRNPANTDGAFRLLYTATPTANYTGIQFNGTSSYADTRMFETGFSSKDANTLGFYSATNQFRFEMDIGARDFITVPGFALTFMYLRAANVTTTLDFGSQGDPDIFNTITRTDGMFIGTRTGATAAAVYQNGSIVSPAGTTASVGLGANSTILVGARGNGPVDQFSSKKYSFALAYNGGLNASQVLILSNLINQYNGNVESALSLSSGSRKVY